MLTKKTLVLSKIEVTKGVDAVPTAALDAVKVQNVTAPAPANAKMYQQSPVKPTLGMEKSLYGGSLWQVTFDVLIKGSGAVDTAPEFGSLLQACGLLETITPTTGPVDYDPLSTAIPSVTLYVYTDGKLYIMLGCQGNNPFNLVGGDPGVLSFTMTGHLVLPVTDAALPTPTFDTTEAPIVRSAGFTIDAYAASISTLTLDPGNVIAMPVDVNSADAFGDVEITDRDPNGTLDPLDVLIATKDFVADWTSGSAMVLTTGVIGTVAGNRYTLSGPAASYRSAGPADREGLVMQQLAFGLAESAGDDQFKLSFT